MKQGKVTESEILDVVLGGCDKDLEEQVHRSARTDMRSAGHFADWDGVANLTRDGMKQMREMSGRVHCEVLEQLDETKSEQTAETWHSVKYRVSFRFSWKSAASVAASAIVVGGLVLGGVHIRSMNTFIVASSQGEVSLVNGNDVQPVASNERLYFPAHLRLAKDARIELRLPHKTGMSGFSGADIHLAGSREVSQESGVVYYSVLKTEKGLDDFTVHVPHGDIVDLGTEFEVSVLENKATVVRVDSGRVRIKANSGDVLQAGGGERAILSREGAITELSPAPGVFGGTENEKDEVPDGIEVAYSPRVGLLDKDDDLLTFVKAQEIVLSANGAPNVVRAPPFTSNLPLLGTIHTRVDGHVAQVAVACDEKLNGKGRIYFDADLNGDLTDDPYFDEGEDYAAGQPFTTGLLGKNNTVWLQRPIRIDRSSSPPTVGVAADRLEYINRVYLEDEVEIAMPDSDENKVKHRFVLLDTDSDGDCFDPGGSLGLWTTLGNSESAPRIIDVAPLDKPVAHMGYKWTLKRGISDELTLVGQKLNKDRHKQLQTGKLLPKMKLQTVDGEQIEVGGVMEEYLLIYVWSTWFSSCQRDVPYDFNDLHDRFSGRGLKMLGISVDYRKDDLISYIEANKITYPQVYNGADLSEGAAGELGIDRWPQGILVDPTGTVISTGKSATELWSFLDSNLPK